jgi:hypothetical protein
MDTQPDEQGYSSQLLKKLIVKDEKNRKVGELVFDTPVPEEISPQHFLLYTPTPEGRPFGQGVAGPQPPCGGWNSAAPTCRENTRQPGPAVLEGYSPQELQTLHDEMDKCMERIKARMEALGIA